jgi:protein-disulfide isomerase
MSRLSACTIAAFVLLAGSLGGCAKPDAGAAGTTPAPAAAAVSSGGEVATASALGGSGGAGSDTASNAADRGRIRGAEGAQVWLVEVSDFQCPFCKRWHDDVFPTIDREYVQTGKVRMAYINFPLSSIHPNARAASEAAMCASVQGKFWELHSSLFQTQAAWAAMKDPMPSFDSLAVAAKVDPAAWRRCMTTHATAALIDADRERASRSGVSSTPSFFVGNRGFVGSFPIDTFRVVLDSAIARARGGR